MNYTAHLLQNGCLDPSYLYSDYGASLYNLILQQPEYYLNKFEEVIFFTHYQNICDRVNTVVIEPGCGTAEKIRFLKDSAMEHYFGVDISIGNIQRAEKNLERYVPDVSFNLGCMNYLLDPIIMPEELSCESKTIFFPGSSIGNFSPDDATKLLRLWGTNLVPGDNLIISQDLLKTDIEMMYKAYNDEAQITARFVLAALTEANRRGRLSIKPEAFQYASGWDAERGCMVLGVVCNETHQMYVNNDGPLATFELSENDTTIDCELLTLKENQFITIEECYKYSDEQFISIVEAAGYQIHTAWYKYNDQEEKMYGIYEFGVKEKDGQH